MLRARISSILVFSISALLSSAFSESPECASADVACSAHNSAPAVGQALMQNRKFVFQLPEEKPIGKLGLVSQVPEELSEEPGQQLSEKSGDHVSEEVALPPGAFDLLNKRLCKVAPSHSKDSRKSRKKSQSNASADAQPEKANASADTQPRRREQPLQDSRKSHSESQSNASADAEPKARKSPLHSQSDASADTQPKARESPLSYQSNAATDAQPEQAHASADAEPEQVLQASLPAELSPLGPSGIQLKRDTAEALRANLASSTSSPRKSTSARNGESTQVTGMHVLSKSTARTLGIQALIQSEKPSAVSESGAGSNLKISKSFMEDFSSFSWGDEALVQSEKPSVDSGEDLEFSKSFMDNWEDMDSSKAVNATFDEAGYEEVAQLQDEGEMKSYIQRLAHSCNMKVTDDGGLNGVVGYFSGGESATLKDLKEAMFSALLASSEDHWVDIINSKEDGVTGQTASMDLLGYVQVRSLRDAKQMITYVRRMVQSMGMKIVDKGGFDGLMRFYSDPNDSQSFQKLVSEIKKAGYEHSWAELE